MVQLRRDTGSGDGHGRNRGADDRARPADEGTPSSTCSCFTPGLLLGGDFTVGDYLLWNEIPTVVGNLVGGLAFVGLTLYATHLHTGSRKPPAPKPVTAEKVPVG